MQSFEDMSAARKDFNGGTHDSEGDWLGKFMEHHERMRWFLKYHLTRRMIWKSSIGEMLPYDIRHDLVETGGATDAIDEGDWVFFLPLRSVTSRHFIFN